VATQTNICNMLGIPSSSTEEEIVDAYVEILQSELSGEALLPREQFDEVYRTYQEWIDWKKQSLALVRVLQEESLKNRIVPRDEFEDFYGAYQEWNRLKKQNLSLVHKNEHPAIVIQLSAKQALLALISTSAVVTSFLLGGGILLSQKSRPVPIVITEEPIDRVDRSVPLVPNPNSSAPAPSPTAPKPTPTVTQKKSATPAIPLSGVTSRKSSAELKPAELKKVSPTAQKPLSSLFPASPSGSAAPEPKTAPTQNTPPGVGSPEGPKTLSESTENTLQTLQAISIELENGSTIPASQLLKLNLSQDQQKDRKLSKFLKELVTSRDVAQARLISEIPIPQLQELAKEAKSLP
jgi:hypothetical protein